MRSNYLKSALTWLPELILRVILVLAGWGMAHLRAFFGDPARAALIATFLLSFAVATALRIEFNPFRNTGGNKSPWAIALGALLLPILYAVVAGLDRAGVFSFPDWPALRWVGVSFFAAGDMIRLVALRELGRQYSAFLTIQAEHRLIQTGLYRRIRHPFYLGQVLAEPGIMLALRSPLAIVIVAASIPFVVKRIHREELMLLDHFGENYRSYCAHTNRLLPHIY
jgi:protein-S-isoprenylcysteine O-methyltransferase Ste14